MIWITHVSLMISESYDLNYSLLLSTTPEGAQEGTRRRSARRSQQKSKCWVNLQPLFRRQDRCEFVVASWLPIVSMWVLCSLSLMIWITHVSLMISESYDLNYSCESYDLWVLWSELHVLCQPCLKFAWRMGTSPLMFGRRRWCGQILLWPHISSPTSFQPRGQRASKHFICPLRSMKNAFCSRFSTSHVLTHFS